MMLFPKTLEHFSDLQKAKTKRVKTLTEVESCSRYNSLAEAIHNSRGAPHMDCVCERECLCQPVDLMAGVQSFVSSHLLSSSSHRAFI